MSMELTLYYDGHCGFCRAEMARLRGWDKAGRIHFVDIAAPGFSPEPLGVSLQALNTELHARTADGRTLAGIDSILAAYAAVGQGWRVWPLRMVLLRPALSALYRSFARNRYRISAMLGRDTPACSNGVCERKIF
jgi:predicted DCC family thiol-disulfide oxidoreductase YuxK